MKTSFKNEVRNFEVTGVTTRKHKDGEIVSLAFSAQAKGRLVSWNNITGDTAVRLARITTEGFGPKDISFRDFDWVVHILRRGKPVTRHMKSTPRKNTINHALAQLLAPALLGADTHPDRPFINEKEVAPKVARKRTRKSKKDPGLTAQIISALDAVGTEVPKVDPEVALHNVQGAPGALEMPEFLKR